MAEAVVPPLDQQLGTARLPGYTWIRWGSHLSHRRHLAFVSYMAVMVEMSDLSSAFASAHRGLVGEFETSQDFNQSMN